jgi:DNA-binding transcriptional MerR regulator
VSGVEPTQTEPARPQAPGGPGVLTIGEVIGRLAGDFPDLTVSKIRYLESGGLISPERTPAGYRRFTEDDIEKLRWVLSAQRDQYLPLKVIRQHLASGDRGQGAAGENGGAATTAAANGHGHGDAAGTDPEFFQGLAAEAGELHLSRDGLARTSGVTGSFLDDLVAYGLLPAAESYGGDAVFIVRAATALTEFGLEPRHLRPLLTGARNTAGLLSSLLPVRRHDGVATAGRRESASAAAARTSEAASAAVRLYAALLRSELGQAATGAGRTTS